MIKHQFKLTLHLPIINIYFKIQYYRSPPFTTKALGEVGGQLNFKRHSTATLGGKTAGFTATKTSFPREDDPHWFRSVPKSDWWNVCHASRIPARTVRTYSLIRQNQTKTDGPARKYEGHTTAKQRRFFSQRDSPENLKRFLSLPLLCS